MVATPSKLMSFAAVAATCLCAVVYAAPIETNPITPLDVAAPLDETHPAFGAPLRGNVVEARIFDDSNVVVAESLTITNTSAVEIVTAGGNGRHGLHQRSLEGAQSDMDKIAQHFGSSLEVNYNTLKSKYASGSAAATPWPASYWPVYQDSINSRWTNEASPAEKYAKAFGKNVKQFMDTVSQKNGIDQFSSRKKCQSDSGCSSLGDGSKCAKRTGASSGTCIPTWWGICHAWAPASNWEPEPKCDVVKNGVTFHPFDLKGLVTAVYDGANIETVFTGSRFNGADSPANLDKYGRYTDATRRDLGAGFFHIAIANIMGQFKHSFVVDVTAGAEVWNQPVRSYEVLKSELRTDIGTASNEYFGTKTYPFNKDAKQLVYIKNRFSWIVESYDDGALIPGRADEFTRSMDYEYFLELDAKSNVIGGEWLGKSRTDHPDFLWFAKSTPPKNTVTEIGLSYKEVRALIDESILCKGVPTTAPPTTPAPTTPEPTTPTPNTPTPTPSVTTVVPTTTKPTTPEPSSANTKKPTPAPETEKPGKPTPAPETEKPGKPTPAPETEKPGKPTPAPETEKPGKPTPAPETEKPGKPTPAPETEKPGKPTPAPETEKPGKPTPAPETEKPGKPTPAPETEKPGKPTPAPETEKPGKPTPAPSTDSGKPTPAPVTDAPTDPDAPATVKPIGDSTTAPPSGDGKPTPEPKTDSPTVAPTPAPSSDTGKPTPAPSKPTDPDAPATVKPIGDATTAPPSGDSKPTPPPKGDDNTPAPSSETGKPTTKPKECHA